jgi:N-acetyl-anhydromuramyl-L-alanine amidase AmpD
MPITLIVMHSTDGTGIDGSIETLREKGFSYHYIVDRDGVVYCAFGDRESWVPVASHAGNSYGPLEKDAGKSRSQDSGSRFVGNPSVNPYSIGIAFANYETQNEPLTKAQVDAAAELVKVLKVKCPTIKWVTTHAIVSPGRKTDPKMLDIDKFSESVGIPVWRYSR